MDVIWNPRGVTHGVSHVVHLCERLTLSQVSKEEKKKRVRVDKKMKEGRKERIRRKKKEGGRNEQER